MVQDNAKLDSTSLGDILQCVKEDADTELNLCRSGVTPSLTVQLADFLETNSTLTQMDLTGNRLGEHGAGCLTTSLMKNNTLRSLVLTDCGLTSEALTEWVAFFRSGTNTTLRHLSLANNQIDDDGAEALGEMLQAAKTRNMSFDLRGNDLSTKGLQVLANAMKNARSTAITAVQLENNQDDDEPEAEVYRSRMKFYMRRNKAAIERETLHETFRKIEESSLALMVCHFQHIVLTISEADSLGSVLTNNHSITELRLEDNALPEEDNNIGDGGFRALSELLRVPTTALRAVTIANPTQLSPENGLQEISPSTGSALHYTLANYTLLTTLSLANCGLDDRMVGVLVSGIAWSGRIEALDLQRNNVGDRSIHILVRMMQRCLRLYRLDLSGNEFNLDGLLPLFPVISTHPQLRVLLLGRFSGCEQHTMDQFINAAEQSSTLVQLELITSKRRSSTSEHIASLNARLRAAHGADFDQERQLCKQEVESHEAWCRRRALVHQQTKAFVTQFARQTSGD